MSKTVKIILILVGVIAILVVIGLLVDKDGKGEKVNVEKAELRSIVEKVSASGKIQPETEVKITTEVSGQIVELPIKEGDLVEQGDLLLNINPDIYESAVNRAEAALNTSRSNLSNAKARLAQVQAQFKNAELSFSRNKELHKQGVISQADWENAEASFEVSGAELESSEESVKSAEFAIMSAKASMNEANENLRRTSVKAPQRGTVTALTKELGEGVLGNQMMAGEVILKVSDLSVMEVDVEVNESDIVRVSIGDTASVEVDAYMDQTFRGIVTEIGNTALNSIGGMSMNQVTNFSVKIRILRESYESLCEGKPKEFSPFRPGMSATVDIETAQEFDVLTIPIKAVTTRLDTTSSSIRERMKKKKEDDEKQEVEEPIVCVFMVDDSGENVRIVEVKTGIQDSKFIQIEDGITLDDRVVTGSYDKVSRLLKNGDKIVIAEEEKEKEKD